MITTDFEDATFNEQYPKSKFSIEVEKKYKGKYCTFEVIVPNTNRDIDTTKSLKGNTVIVHAYVDENKGFLKLVAQDIIIVGLGKPRVKTAAPVEEVKPAADIKVEVKNVEELPDDDLPF